MAKVKSSLASLPPESLQSCLESLMDIYSCSICLEVVRPDPVQCVNEHILCQECKAELTECPTCRRPFSEVKPSRFVSQVIEVLPKTCKHKNCDVFLKADDDHEIFCCLKETICELCDKKMPGQDILTHLKEEHPNEQIFTGNKRACLYQNFDPDVVWFSSSAYVIKDHFIWVTAENEPDDEIYYVTCYLVPNGKPKDNIFFKITFHSKVSEFMCKIKLNPDEDSPNDNTINVPLRLLPDYIDDGNDLRYTVEFITEPI